MASQEFPLFPPSTDILILPFERNDPFPSIPTFFSLRLEKKLPFICRLIDSHGVITNVRFYKGDYCCHFGEGWRQIGSNYTIEDGGWVVLTYKSEGEFDMQVYDRFWTAMSCVKLEQNCYDVGDPPKHQFLYFPFDPVKKHAVFPAFFQPAYVDERLPYGGCFYDPSGTYYGVDLLDYEESMSTKKVILSTGWEKIADVCKIRDGGWVLARYGPDGIFNIRVFNSEMVEAEYLNGAYVFKSPTYLLEEFTARVMVPRVVYGSQPATFQWSFEKFLTKFQRKSYLVLPLEFIKTALRHQPPSVYLIFEDHEGRHVEIHRPDRMLRPFDASLATGWASFCTLNKLKTGMLLFFGMNSADEDKIYVKIVAKG